MVHIPIHDGDGEQVFGFMGQTVSLKRGRLQVLRSLSPQRRARVKAYLRGDLPPAESAIWGKVAAGLANDLGIELEGTAR